MTEGKEKLEKVTEALLVMQCAKCKIGNEVMIPIGDQRVFAVQCHKCKKLNEITIDTENGPLILAEGKAEWNKHIKEMQAAAAAAKGSGEDREDGEHIDDGEDGAEEEEEGDGVEEEKDEEVEVDRASAVPPKKRQKGLSATKSPKATGPPPAPPAPVPPAPPPTDDGVPKPAVVKPGSAVLAKFNDGYYYHGIVEDMEGRTRFFIAWEDGDPTSWVTARHTALLDREACASEVNVGMPVLALWTGKIRCEGEPDEVDEDIFFPAKVTGRTAEGLFELKWLDGGERFRATAPELRLFVSLIADVEIIPPPSDAVGSTSGASAAAGASVGGGGGGGGPVEEADEDAPLSERADKHGAHETATKNSSSSSSLAKARKPHAPDAEMTTGGRGGSGSGGGLKDDLRRRSGRDLHKGDPSDTRLLDGAMGELRKVWAGNAPSGADGAWRLERNVGGVPGLAVCVNFLDAAEVEAMRTIFGSHRTWAQYSYGTARGAKGLASVVQRIDFGPEGLQAEGLVGGSPVWRLGKARAALLQLLGDRLRHVFGAAKLWAETQPDTMQLTKIGANQKIANHLDRRDKWLEGIATLAWSELPCEADLRGESWTLNMEIGKGPTKRVCKIPMEPGSAYILMGAAQGCTRVCKRKCVGHSTCTCCWTHGVDMVPGASVTRHSMTLRVLNEDSDDDSDGDEDGGDDDDGIEEAAAEAEAPPETKPERAS